MTAPKQLSRVGVAMLCPPMEDYPNPGSEAQEEEEGVERFGSGASMSYMTRLEMNIQWTMQVSCMSPSDSKLRRPKQ